MRKQNRAPQGIPTGGQYTAAIRPEPELGLLKESDPQVLANLQRSLGQATPVTEQQAQGLRRHRTPIKDVIERQVVVPTAPRWEVLAAAQERAAS